MRYFVKLAVILCVVASSFSKPFVVDEPVDGDQEEMEYETDEEAAVDDSLHEDDSSRLERQEPTYSEEEEAVENPMDTEEKRHVPDPSDSQSAKEKCNDSPDYKIHNDRESEDMKPNDSYQPQPLQQRSSRYIEAQNANEQAEMPQQLENADKREKFSRRAVHKRRNTKTTTNDDKGDELFGNAVAKERINKLKNHQSNDYAPIEQNHEEFLKSYYRTFHTANDKVKLEDKSYENPSNVYRNRRQANEAEISANTNVNDQNTVNENEETAIKRHLKKLTDQELESLLNSLPSEKRNLLNSIIENIKSHYDGVSKRDITKKAGAVEENNDIDNGVFDSNKVHGSSVEIKNDVVSTIDTTDNSKPPEYHTEISGVAGAKEISSQEISHEKDVSANVDDKSSVNSNEVSINGENKNQVESNIQSSKLNNKRETSLNDFENQRPDISDTKFVNNDFNPSDLIENGNYDTGSNYQNDNLSQLNNNEVLLENNVLDHANKREALLENTDSFKSLEESFPNSNTDKESGEYSEIDMVPLVRVKRRNEDALTKKRSALPVQDAKIAHIPYRAENDDDDSEEGNEFEDDGFFDRTSNFAKDCENSRLSDNVMPAKKIQTKSKKLAHGNISPDTNIESDTMNIGSDSDSVLSGVEGVDDNLMYNSGARNRRTIENKPTDLVSKDSGLSSLIEMESKSQSDNLNGVNYQESEAFGPFPQNYDGGTSRMKRIRQVKLPSNIDSSPDAQE